ncbi:PAS domain-containing protein [bacterium]|nr:PAS domain-containing protein [bacterium]
MINNMNLDQISALIDALPFELMFVDENDRVQYGNKIGTRLFRFKNENMAGRDIRSCHPKNIIPKVEKILSDFKAGTADEAEFWIPSLAPKILNRFIALRDESGKYLGILEYVLDFNAIEKIAIDKKDAPQR